MGGKITARVPASELKQAWSIRLFCLMTILPVTSPLCIALPEMHQTGLALPPIQAPHKTY